MTSKNKPKLSVVIPAYNEAQRFQITLPQIIKFFSQQKFTTELIIVDDGSTDETLSVIKQLAGDYQPLIVKTHPKNQGKGAGLRTGILASHGNWVLFMDADLSTPLQELDKFWKYTKNFDVIIGSRKMKGANVKKRQNPIRENLGKVFTILTNILATKNLSDITCGFKMLKGPVARQLFAKSQINDWSYDAEILFLAQKYRHPLKEVPVEWHNDPRTKVSLLKDGLKSLVGLLRIRANDMQGYY